MTKNRIAPLLALMLVMGAFLFSGAIPAYAAEDTTEQTTLTISDYWLEGEMLNITFTNNECGESQSMELNLRDYAQSGDEYVTVQVTDTEGRTSNTIRFKNPYYLPSGETAQPNGGSDAATNDGANGTNPFTPDGTGTVMDNANSGDGKEFFTVSTPEGNVFYLIIDRQRNADNVYFLNAVTEQDLMALAVPGESAPSPLPPTTSVSPEPDVQSPDGQVTATPPAEKSGGNSSIILVVIAVIAAGGLGYYFKIVRPKRNAADDDDYAYEQEEFDDDTEVSIENDEDEEEYDE